MQQQSELFKDLAPAVNSDGRFLEYRTGDKVIQVPLSFWKDGRTRADLSAYGAGEVVSRNRVNLEERIIDALSSVFPSLVQAVREEFARDRKRQTRPRSSNKRPSTPAAAAAPAKYINPFRQEWAFAKCPDWLFSRREPMHSEKQVYARLLLPLPPICRRYDQGSGVIFGLDQGELAKALGIRRETVNAALKALRLRGLLEIRGAAGAKQVIRFLWHEWMSATCALNAQVAQQTAVRSEVTPCVISSQQPVRKTLGSCAPGEQVAEAVYKIESNREKRKTFCSFVPEGEGEEP
jgi:CRP-like cAMP-binding protein